MALDWKKTVQAASKVEGFNASAQRAPKTAQEVVAAAIDRQIELFNKPKTEGRRWFEIVGDNVGFAIRYANSPLKLVGDETKVVVPKAQFVEVMEAIKADILKGDFKAQLDAGEAKVRTRAEKIKGVKRK
ncbi:hypothetical protein [Sphingobium sp. KCTC 72723]|uniref:hypothetical protein n=1 Tax=Sphingobium sp. KCTC 72723 TaxID=2733867 RepID=UPI00165DBCBB|nr:hypothetical protein [Sphingobium sp. KCTC 72723]